MRRQAGCLGFGILGCELIRSPILAAPISRPFSRHPVVSGGSAILDAIRFQNELAVFAGPGLGHNRSVSPLTQMIEDQPHSLSGLAVDQDLSGNREGGMVDRKSTRLNSSHVEISYAVFCLKKKKKK